MYSSFRRRVITGVGTLFAIAGALLLLGCGLYDGLTGSGDELDAGFDAGEPTEDAVGDVSGDTATDAGEDVSENAVEGESCSEEGATDGDLICTDGTWVVDQDCEPEGDRQFCERYDAECGAVVGNDNCEDARFVDCGQFEEFGCGPAGTCLLAEDEPELEANSCACPDIDFEAEDQEICDGLGAECGSVEPADWCDWEEELETESIQCGECEGGGECGEASENVCGCPCEIDGGCYAEGDSPEDNPCVVCDPERSSTEFSDVEDGVPCDDNAVCSAGECACQSGYDDCGDGCVDLQTHDDHCGDCTTTCGEFASCESGQCQCEDTRSNQAICDEAQVECGTVQDGCGDDVICEYCSDGAICDLAEQSCGCIPTDCSELGDPCGIVPDECGGSLFCSAGSGCSDHLGLGAKHSCAIDGQGGVRCWGHNEDGQLGTGDTAQSLSPKEVVDDGGAVFDEEVRQLALGNAHSCARTDDGIIVCWGDNSSNQLTELSSSDHTTYALEISNLPQSAQTLGTGSHHSCVEHAPGQLSSWGSNWQGELGVGDTDWYTTPQEVIFAGDDTGGIQKFDGGPMFSCYLDVSGDLYCWGENIFGQTGSGDADEITQPKKVAVLDGEDLPLRDFSAGGAFGDGSGVQMTIGGFTCVVDAGDGVQCWGYGDHGQLGDELGGGNHSTEPVQVQGLEDGVEEIVLGGEHACALLADGAVRCWGYNEYGQLGNGTTDDSAEPVDVELPEAAISVFAGEFHTCAALETGGLHCWGQNEYGQLGDGTTKNRLEPVVIFD